MGVLAVGVGKVNEALPFLKTALEANPNIGQFWVSYIDALIKLERIDDAKAVFDQAKSKGAKGEAFDQIEKRLTGVSTTNAVKNSNVQDPPAEILQNMINLYTQGQYQQTLSLAIQMLTDFSSSISLYNIIGAANQSLGRFDRAIEAYKKAISIEPDNADIYNNIGVALKDQGKLEEAIESFKKAVSINPDFFEAHHNMANTLSDHGKLKEAIEAYTRALSINPNYAEAFKNLGIALKDQGKLEEAIESFKKAISIKPDFAEAFNDLGNVLKHQSKLEEAIEAYTKALSLKPDYAEAYNNIGGALIDQGNLEEAIEAYTKALSLKPDYFVAWNNLYFPLQSIKKEGNSDQLLSQIDPKMTTLTIQK